MKQLIVKAHLPVFFDVDTECSTKNEIKKKRKSMLDNRAVPDHVNIAECMTFPKIKAKGEVEGDGALFPYFLEVKM